METGSLLDSLLSLKLASIAASFWLPRRTIHVEPLRHYAMISCFFVLQFTLLMGLIQPSYGVGAIRHMVVYSIPGFRFTRRLCQAPYLSV